jgi:chromosomal replication initiator protein
MRKKGCKMLPALSSDNRNVLHDLRETLQQKLGPRRYQNWFGGSTRLELEQSQLVLHVQSPYLVKWIQKQFESELLSIAAQVVGPDVTVRYEVGTDVVLSPLPESGTALRAPVASHSRRTETNSAPQSVHGRTKRVYSLADIVSGEANALAVAGVQRFLVDPGSVSPLYLQGGIGNGKTHLLEGLRARLRKEMPHLQVLLLTAEHFCNYFTQALAARTLPSFRARFRNIDILLVDDIDFLDGKKGFQEEFLHTLKQFEQEGRHIAVTANRHPRLLTRTSDELVSRFLSGLICRIEGPDESMRLEIVQRHVQRQRARLTPDAQAHIANRFTTNVRELEGAVNLLATWSSMTKQAVTVSTARKLLGRLERDCLRLIRISDVENAVCEFFGIEQDLLRSASRKQSLSQPRMLAMYLARKLTQTAYSEIGAHFGGRNHSTVMSAERKIAEQLNSSQAIRVASENWSLPDILKTLEDRIKAG